MHASSISDALIAQLKQAYGHTQEAEPEPAWRLEEFIEPPKEPIDPDKPPRAWPADRKAKWKELPEWAREIVSKREAERDAALHRAQNKAAEYKHQLKELRNCLESIRHLMPKGTLEEHLGKTASARSTLDSGPTSTPRSELRTS